MYVKGGTLMALVTMKQLLTHAQENQYAVGYFEAWNMESLLAVIDAAERSRSPVIIGFNGEFLANPQRRIHENIYHYGALAKTAAEHASVPVALLLNEADSVSMLVNGLHAGFTAIMHHDSRCSFEETVEINRYLVQTAHYLGADVEAEVGELPDADRASSYEGGHLTDPDKAAYFVDRTGVDALAVSVGNVHLLEGGKSALDFDLIRTLRKKVKVPLVLHGGTGISPEHLKEAIRLGMCKVNVGTVLRRVFINHVRGYMAEHNVENYIAHEVMSTGGPLDVFAGAREAMTEEVIRFIQLLGSKDKA
jgi:ketose-bisphosphate aldolase